MVMPIWAHAADEPTQPDQQNCAATVIATGMHNALIMTDPETNTTFPVVTAESHSVDIDIWVNSVLGNPEIITQILKCPEFANVDEMQTVKLPPIEYSFPNGRTITVNYATQPKLLKQKLQLSQKRDPSKLDDPNPRLGPGETNGYWTNTDPAWYGIMVVQHGALDAFVGPDKNNTISLEYIVDNINSLYPNAMWGGGACTSRGAIAGDTNAINRAGVKAVGMAERGEEDSNDYYVAGDINLEWIGWAEVAADIVLTIVSWGGWAALSGGIKAARLSRAIKTATKTLKNLAKIPDVKTYAQLADRADGLRDSIKALEGAGTAKDMQQAAKYADQVKDLEKQMDTLKQGKEAKNIQKYINTTEGLYDAARATDQMRNAKKVMKEIDAAMDVVTNNKHVQKLIQAQDGIQDATQRIKTLQKTITKGEKNIAKLQKRLDKLTPDSKEYKQISKQLDNATDDLAKTKTKLKNADDTLRKHTDDLGSVENVDEVKQYKNLARRREDILTETNRFGFFRYLRGGARTQTGNVVGRSVRSFRGLRAALGRGKNINKITKGIRSSATSGKVRDWLFHATMRSVDAVARFQRKTSVLYLVVKMVGDMYDFTSTSTGEYTSNVDFKPFLLLSADDLEGQDNVVNYGMWLMWMGDSMSAADDDAAYLQAMDFASKFHEDLMDVQNDTASPCDVDIFVVRPILRHPYMPYEERRAAAQNKDTDNLQLYYLIMNDIPWTTHQ